MRDGSETIGKEMECRYRGRRELLWEVEEIVIGAERKNLRTLTFYRDTAVADDGAAIE